MLQNAIDTCPDDTSGNIERCPALAKSIDRAKQQACLPENEIVDEDVGLGTWLSQLPGTNQVSSRSMHGRIGKTAVDDDADCCADGSPRITAQGHGRQGCQRWLETVGRRRIRGQVCFAERSAPHGMEARSVYNLISSSVIAHDS